jgi:hypothetical protein
MGTEVVVALIVAFASLIGALLAFYQAHAAAEKAARTQETLAEKTTEAQLQLEQLRATIATQAAEHNARRDYEYEARKRLYTECEPLLFQLGESADAALSRVQRIAKAAQQGHLEPNPGNWLGSEGYFMLSTMYRMIVPHVYVRLLQEALTSVDLTVDPALGHQYRLAQAFHRSLTDDFKLAGIDPELPYDPNHRDAVSRIPENPSVYRRQGLYSGVRDRVVEALIKQDASGRSRPMSYGEFEAAYRNPSESVHKTFKEVKDLFYEFKPATHPVLWRVLIAQAHICHEIRQTQDARLAQMFARAGAIPPRRNKIEPSSFEWRPQSDVMADDAVLMTTFEVGKRYLARELSQ